MPLRSADIEPEEVMISSQVDHKSSPIDLTGVRDGIAAGLEGVVLGGKPLFRVWRCEAKNATAQTDTTWDICTAAAKRADVVLVLYTGRAGWVRDKVGIGICHAEYEAGIESNPGKVAVVAWRGNLLDVLEDRAPADGDSPFLDGDIQFHVALSKASGWRVAVSEPDDLVTAGLIGVADVVSDLAMTGRRVGSRGRTFLGEGLRWAGLEYSVRADEMRAAVRTSIGAAGGATLAIREVGGTRVAFVVHAVPGPYAQPDARALMGHPLRAEVGLLDEIRKAAAVGPIHVIAVYGNVTETQVRSFMGRPDAFIAPQPFGVYAADDATFSQALFISGARDSDAIANGISSALA